MAKRPIEEISDRILEIIVECSVDDNGVLNKKGQKAFEEICRRAEKKAKELNGEIRAE